LFYGVVHRATLFLKKLTLHPSWVIGTRCFASQIRPKWYVIMARSNTSNTHMMKKNRRSPAIQPYFTSVSHNWLDPVATRLLASLLGYSSFNAPFPCVLCSKHPLLLYRPRRTALTIPPRNVYPPMTAIMSPQFLTLTQLLFFPSTT
jgi:hypothetical protein